MANTPKKRTYHALLADGRTVSGQVRLPHQLHCELMLSVREKSMRDTITTGAILAWCAITNNGQKTNELGLPNLDDWLDRGNSPVEDVWLEAEDRVTEAEAEAAADDLDAALDDADGEMGKDTTPAQ